jgi:hypothetical protein
MNNMTDLLPSLIAIQARWLAYSPATAHNLIAIVAVAEESLALPTALVASPSG